MQLVTARLLCVLRNIFCRENIVRFLVFYIIPYTILLIIYNIYPFYNYSGEPHYPKLPVRDIYGFRILFIDYCIFLSIMYFIQYIVPMIYLKKYYGLGIKNLSKPVLVLLIIYIVYVLSPAIMYWIYTVEYILLKPYLNEGEAFTVAYGFIAAIYSSIIVMYLAPTILYILFIMMLRTMNNRFSSKHIVFYALSIIIIQIILLNIQSSTEVLVDALITYVFGEQALVIYLRGWNPAILEMLRNNPGEIKLMIPSWGAFIALTIYSLLLYKTIKTLINKTMKT